MVYLPTKAKLIWKVRCAVPPIFSFKYEAPLLLCNFGGDLTEMNTHWTMENWQHHTHLSHKKYLFKCQIPGAFSIEKQSRQNYWEKRQKKNIFLSGGARQETNMETCNPQWNVVMNLHSTLLSDTLIHPIRTPSISKISMDFQTCKVWDGQNGAKRVLRI